MRMSEERMKTGLRSGKRIGGEEKWEQARAKVDMQESGEITEPEWKETRAIGRRATLEREVTRGSKIVKRRKEKITRERAALFGRGLSARIQFNPTNVVQNNRLIYWSFREGLGRGGGIKAGA